MSPMNRMGGMRRMGGPPEHMRVLKHEKAVVPTIKIKLAVDHKVYLDGIHESSFVAGQVVDFPITIAQTLLEDGKATEFEAFGKVKPLKQRGPGEAES